ncbi:translocation/assembly module TamB [Candidatus Babeliales bacterium]|nr:translocation/assembly module TamB [Candidatus Babeliales bacterium]
MIKWLRRAALSLITGLVITLLMVQNSKNINQLFLAKLTEFLQKEWHATIVIDSSSFNFFTSSIVLNQGSITSTKHNGCSWGFEKGKIYISPLELLLHKKICLYLTFYNVSGSTGFTGNSPDILDHLNNIFETKSDDLKVSPRAIALHHLVIDTALGSIPLHAEIDGTFELKKSKLANKQSRWDGQLTTQAGSIIVNNKQLIKSVKGASTFGKYKRDTLWTINAQHSIETHFDEHVYKVCGTCSQEKKLITLSSEQQKLAVQIKHESEKFLITGNLPLELTQRCATFFATNAHAKPSEIAQGTCVLDLTLNYAHQATGSIVAKNIKYKDFIIEQCACTNVALNEKKLSTNVHVKVSPTIGFDGTCSWNFERKTGSLSCSNKQQLQLSSSPGQLEAGWVISPGSCTLEANITAPFSCTGTYACTLHHELIDQLLPLCGTLEIHDQELTINGTADNDSYIIQARSTPKPHISNIVYKKNDTTPVVNMHTQRESMVLAGSIYYPFIQSLLSQQCKRLILGSKNFLQISVNQENLEEITGSIGLEQGKFYIPESRNLIEKLASNFAIYPHSKKIVLSNNVLGFCKGSVSCPQATLTFNDSYHLNFVHAPIQIDNLFVNWKKDFYGFIDSSLLLLKFPGSPAHASGSVVLKKSLLKNNIFSEETNNRFFLPTNPLAQHNQTIDVDLRIGNEIPVKIVTPSLETTAHLDLHVQYQQQNVAHLPHVNGSITLDNGFIKFLRNKLFIEYGKIQFVTAHANDPLIDLVAKNRINKYMVNLQVTGSLQKPNIVLESAPVLTEEQILGLLLAGSENATLQADLPSMIMQNLHNIVLGSKAVMPKATSFFEKVARPFKYVQISPNFTDQTGRGGIRGTISIDLNKQIHAQLQKNFNLQDDFAFQVEYFLSDDVNLKVVKDQRGDLGSEVEVRFKF